MPELDQQFISRAERYLIRQDPVLAGVIRAVGKCTLKPRRRGFESLVRSIVSQQISVAAAKTILGRLQDQLPGRRITPTALHGLNDEQFIAAGISRQKATYLRDLTRCCHEGRINFRRIAKASDEAIITELTQVKGIGRWTAQMFLIFNLGRPDIFAPEDLGLKNAIKKCYDIGPNPSPLELEEIAACWSPWRSIASWYLWRSLEL